MKKKWLKSPLYRWLLLLYIFITVFFPLGFYTLLAGPSKWVIEAALKNSWSEYNEKLMQRLVILGLVVISLTLALLFRKFFLSKVSSFLRYVFISLLSVIFLISVYLFSFQPEVFIQLSGVKGNSEMQSSISESGQNIEFITGAYPDLKELKRLKKAGYTAVVSLLNELVMPAEPNLISEEAVNVKKVGIKLIRIPMLPWVSGNNESITLIQKLVKEGHGKYYVHCYLGRDRVNVFRKIVRDMGARSQSLQNERLRHIEDLPRFERGAYTKLAKDVYLTPFPTDDEFFGYIVNGQIATVVSLFDPKNPEDTTWISKEKNILLRYGVKYINLPVADDKDLKGIQQLCDKYATFKRPLVIHKYASDDPIYKVLIQKLGTKKH
jgi:protein tyrosine phosphatase (PTP) superfamily phosphohydrolase (DUF442 family)